MTDHLSQPTVFTLNTSEIPLNQLPTLHTTAMAAATTAPEPSAHQFPLPQILQHPSSTPPTLITQGAEGRLYRTTFLQGDIPCALKYRPPKPWRHPILDQRLTKHRILSEARILVKCKREGVRVPLLYGLDESAGWLMLEWIQGTPVRANINTWLGSRTEGIEQDEELKALMRKIGSAIGTLHKIGIVHGDLTTSNMMLDPNARDSVNGTAHQGADGKDVLQGEIVIIDLGLASGSVHEEDRAVDLYVLERAFGSTHPRADCVFQYVLEAYKESFKQAPIVLKKLEDVRMRGRKRSMIG